MERTKIAEALEEKAIGREVLLKGWVRTKRDAAGGFSFIELNDGSCLANIQVVVDGSVPNYESEVRKLSTGASIAVKGLLKESPAKGQKVEVQAREIEVYGWADASFPIQKKRHTFEYLREVAHLRTRTNTFGAMARVRNTLCWAIHQFFQSRGFLYLNSPIITASDCEGAGAMFHVTTFDLGKVPVRERAAGSGQQAVGRVESGGPEGGSGQWAVGSGRGGGRRAEGGEQRAVGRGQWAVGSGGGTGSSDEAATTSPAEVAATRLADSPTRRLTEVDFSQDFFGRATHLTVSGQLQGEIFACSVGDVYTFGPTFRAENSNTSRHLAEFWMVEPEMAFCDLEGNMRIAEDFIKSIVREVLERSPADMAFFNERIELGLLDMLRGVIASEFVRLSYTEAIEILRKSGEEFEFEPRWGGDLQAEHERYLTERHFRRPVILFDYPRTLKPFYMRVNDDGRTVRAMDVLVPRVGELIGGSQREERLDLLEERMREQGLDQASYWWYRDLRRWGTVPHAGFGLGLERALQFMTGMGNIRDCIAFPRTPGNAEF